MRQSVDSRFLDLQTLRAALGGYISNGQVLCAGPGHSAKDRSLAVRPTARGVIVHSFANDDWRECQEHVRSRLRLPAWAPSCQPRVTVNWVEPAPERRTERAKALWAEGKDPRGTLAEDYLRCRKLHLPPELCGSVLRYHATCPWRDDENGQVVFIPCLIVLFTSIANGEIAAIHRIRVDKSDLWPRTERRMLGAVAGAAVKLDPARQRLAIAEGVETALAARQLGFGATWALGSARRFAPIDGVNELIVLGEHDQASRNAAEACSESWSGRRVFLALPMKGKDFNDYLMGAG
jgi:putative DNA primase/helicase